MAKRFYAKNLKMVRSLALIALATFVFMVAYQVIKSILLPNQTLVQSNTITVVFATVLATVISFFVLRTRDALYQRAVEEIAYRERSERALRESETKYRTLFETMAQGVVYIGRDRRIISANPAAERILGASFEDMHGRDASDEQWHATHEDGTDVADDEHPVIVALRTGMPVRNAIVGILNPRDNSRRWLNVNAIPQFHDDEPTPSQVYATFDDITERKTAKELSDALNRLNTAISSTLDFDQIMQRLVIDAVKAIGSERGVILVRTRDRWALNYAYGFPESVVGAALSDTEAKHAVLAAKTKAPVIIDNACCDERIDAETMEQFGICSVLTVPLFVRDETIGALCFCYHSCQVAFTEQQVDFAQKLSLSVSLALENARLYESERHVADTLQDALLNVPERITGFEFGHLYRSATELARVGGDFFDLFSIGDETIGITIGDVSGKGIGSAAITAVARNTIRAYASEGCAPAEVIAKTNDVMAGQLGPAAFISVFFGVLNAATGELTYCPAGHPPAFIKRETSAVEVLETISPVIGAFMDLKYEQATATLEEGDILVLYTDGVIEARCDSGFFGHDRLLGFLDKLPSTPATSIPQLVFSEVMRCTVNRLSDDLALLTVSIAHHPRS